jgi:quercetin dioxygenase-like cupin family protein
MDMKGPDPKVVASNVYKSLLENDRVRVFDVHFKPGAKAVMHWHPDHVAYIITGGKLKLTLGDGTVTDMDLPAGQAVFLESQSHEAVNIGNTDVHIVVVELLK